MRCRLEQAMYLIISEGVEWPWRVNREQVGWRCSISKYQHSSLKSCQFSLKMINSFSFQNKTRTSSQQFRVPQNLFTLTYKKLVSMKRLSSNSSQRMSKKSSYLLRRITSSSITQETPRTWELAFSRPNGARLASNTTPEPLEAQQQKMASK